MTTTIIALPTVVVVVGTDVCYRFNLIKAFVINVRFRHEKSIYDTRYQLD